jgi:arsenate reductase
MTDDNVVVYHNPVCSKSRGALEILDQRGVDAQVIEYLKTNPSRDELERIVDAIADEPAALVRKDKRFKELELDAADYTTRDEVIAVLLAHPELMERPVVFVGDRAVIARPSERVLELLES